MQFNFIKQYFNKRSVCVLGVGGCITTVDFSRSEYNVVETL